MPISNDSTDLRKIAEAKQWQVWAYDVPTVDPKTGNVDRYLRERVWVLRSPFKVAFAGGKPVMPVNDDNNVPVEQDGIAPNGVRFNIPKRHSEAEAWADLPSTVEALIEYSVWSYGKSEAGNGGAS